MEQTASLLPDLANPPKIKRKRAPKHDFKDGQGKVFAHHHDNGGGWVADTAYVAPAAKVNRNAAVFGLARVHDTCEIEGRARVYGHAKLYDRVRVTGDAQVCDNARLCDNASVHKIAQISENARLSGNTTVDGNVHVFGGAMLHNTRCFNRLKGAPQTIAGLAQIFGSSLFHVVRVWGTVVCRNSNLQDVFVFGAAFVCDSRVGSSIDHSQRYQLGSLTPSQALPDIFVRVDGATVMNSQVTLGPCVIGRATTFHECHFYFHQVPDGMFDGSTPAYYIDTRSTNPGDVRPRGAQNTAAAPMQPNMAHGSQSAIAAALIGTAQRRILRLENI